MEARPSPIRPIIAGVLAWLIPGAGHAVMGRWARGIIIFVCINGLFWAGVGLGGVFTVDPLTQRWWMIAQMSTGASGLVAWRNQEHARRDLVSQANLTSPVPSARPNEAYAWWDRYRKTQARQGLALVHPTDSVAYAYSGIAGMLNMLCIFDAVMLALLGRSGEPPWPPRESKPKPAPAEGTPA